jgi:hypothetical protein
MKTVSELCAELCATIDKCAESIGAGTARINEFRIRGWLRSEPSILHAWKRKPRSFHTRPSGEVIVHGSGQAHRVRTAYLRSQFHAGDVAFLRRVIETPDSVSH